MTFLGEMISIESHSTKHLNVTIVGLGNLGGTTLSLLLQERERTLKINVLDPSPKVEGTFLDLAQSAELNGMHELVLNDWQSAEEAELIFYSAGKTIPIGRTRKFNFQRNARIAKSVFHGRRFREDVVVIVLSNPVEIITNYIASMLKNEDGLIIGSGTLLDTMRLKYFSNVIGSEAPDYIVGEHGSSMAFLGGGQQDEEHRRLMQKVENAANEIKQTQGATYFGAAHCAWRIYEAIIQNRGLTAPLTSWNPELEIYISQLVYLEGSELTLLQQNFINERDKRIYQRAERHIKSSLKSIEA